MLIEVIEAGSFCSPCAISIVFTAIVTPKRRMIKLRFEVLRPG